MPLILFGLSHKTAPVEVREKLSNICEAVLPEVDGKLLEAVALFTCNRLELYFCGDPSQAFHSFQELLISQNTSIKTLKPHIYHKTEQDVIEHLFTVSSGLDSMVLGENQIQHQLKTSYLHCEKLGYTGRNLNKLFQKALEVGKKVRTETGVSDNTTSVASTAVSMAKGVVPNFKDSQALIIGAGEMAEIVALHLKKNGVKNIIFTNRTLESAQKLAQKFDAQSVSTKHLDKLLQDADVIITSTSAPHHIITRNQMQQIMTRRNCKPVFAIDIAVPRDIEPDCSYIENFFLYDIDDLQSVVDQNFLRRKNEAKKAKSIIKNEAHKFDLIIHQAKVAPLIQSLKQEAEQIRQTELQLLFSQNPDLQEHIKQQFEETTRKLMSKWLHKEIVCIKNQRNNDKNRIAQLKKIIRHSKDKNNNLQRKKQAS